MPRLLAFLLLTIAAHAAAAGEARLQVTATILSRCEVSSTRLQARDGTVTAWAARCRGPGASVPYRAGVGSTWTTGSLPQDARVALATTRHGQVLTIEP